MKKEPHRSVASGGWELGDGSGGSKEFGSKLFF